MYPTAARLGVFLPDELVEGQVLADVLEPLAALLDVTVDAKVSGLPREVLRVGDTAHGFVQLLTAEAAANLDGFAHRLAQWLQHVYEVHHLAHGWHIVDALILGGLRGVEFFDCEVHGDVGLHRLNVVFGVDVMLMLGGRGVVAFRCQVSRSCFDVLKIVFKDRIIDIKVPRGLVDEYLGEHLPDAGVLIAWQSARRFVLGYREHLFGAHHTCGNVADWHVNMHEHPPLHTVSKDDDDKPLSQRRDDVAELIRHELCLVALLFRVHNMHPLVEFIRAPCVVKYKEGGDDDQREGWLEFANYKTGFGFTEEKARWPMNLLPMRYIICRMRKAIGLLT